MESPWTEIVPAVVGLVLGLVLGRLTAPQRATVAMIARLARSATRWYAARNPEHTAADTAAEVVAMLCEELGIPETEAVRQVATAAARLEKLTKDASKGAPD